MCFLAKYLLDFGAGRNDRSTAHLRALCGGNDAPRACVGGVVFGAWGLANPGFASGELRAPDDTEHYAKRGVRGGGKGTDFFGKVSLVSMCFPKTFPKR